MASPDSMFGIPVSVAYPISKEYRAGSYPQDLDSSQASENTLMHVNIGKRK